MALLSAVARAAVFGLTSKAIYIQASGRSHNGVVQLQWFGLGGRWLDGLTIDGMHVFCFAKRATKDDEQPNT
jgi:hypothetical protein